MSATATLTLVPCSHDVLESDRAKDEVIAELRQLVTDLRDAAQDGQMLARRYADLLTKSVDEYCVEFEKRAESALARLDEAGL